MDWKLTKSLYILVFLLINIGLIMMYYNKQQEDIHKIEDRPNILEETNIDLSQLPEHEPRKLNILSAVRATFIETEEIEAETAETTNEGYLLKNDFEAGENAPDMTRDDLENHKDEEVYRGSEYEYDDVMSDEGYMLFNQHYEDLPIFNNEAARLLYRGDGQQAMEYEQGYLKNISENEYTSPVAVRDPEKVVANLYTDERISGEADIEDARLGYYIILNDGDQVLLRPKWRFSISDQGVDKTIYVDAISETEDIIERE